MSAGLRCLPQIIGQAQACARRPQYSLCNTLNKRQQGPPLITAPSAFPPPWSAVDITKVAERTISDDLEYLISKTVDTNKADYAVVTGVQIHNWGADFRDESPNMEFVQVTSAYAVVDGVKTFLDLSSVPVRL